MSVMRLEPIQRLLCHFANPQDQLKVIHIAGTNGKGSVSCFIACMLTEIGFRVGRYSSPHLHEPHDAIRINERTIDKQVYWRIHDTVSAATNECSLFEQQTATAFLAFRDLGIEMAVIETGMGGRLDATNVVAHPIATVITPIGHDHMPALGNTLEEVAAEKAGILKPRAPCVLAPQTYPEAADVIRKHAQQLGCRLYEVTDTPIVPDLPLKGRFQRINFAVARQTLTAIGIELDREATQRALKRIDWPGRMQPCVVDGRSCILDGAHNLEGVMALQDFIESEWRGNNQHITWMIGMTATKDPTILQRCLLPGDTVVTLPFDTPLEMPWIQSMPHDTLATGLGRPDALAAPDFRWAFANTSGPVVICGSLYLAAQFLREFPQKSS